MGHGSPGAAGSGAGLGAEPGGGAQGFVSRAGRAGGSTGGLAGVAKTDAVPLTGQQTRSDDIEEIITLSFYVFISLSLTNVISYVMPLKCHKATQYCTMIPVVLFVLHLDPSFVLLYTSCTSLSPVWP